MPDTTAYEAQLVRQLRSERPDLLRAAEDELQRLRGLLATVAGHINNPAYDHTARAALATALGLPRPGEAMTTVSTYAPGIRSAAKRLGITPAQYVALKAAGFKWCRDCKEWRPTTDYKPSTSTPDGLRPLCTRHYKPPNPVPIPHGRITGYSRGCRCPECRKANTDSQNRRKAERRQYPAAADRAGHGKYTTYINYACRCDPCKQAQSERNKHYAQLRKQRQEGTNR